MRSDERVGLGDAVRAIISEDGDYYLDGDKLTKTGDAVCWSGK
jgi:hypothetical protein